MKEYLIFNIKDEFMKLYKDRPSELFSIFNRIYYMKAIDKNYGYNLFSQIANFYDKQDLNNFLYNKYKDKIMYSSNYNEHIINNLFLNEISILNIRNSNIKIETNHEENSFLNDLKEYSKNLFVCNFKEQEFFFLKNFKSKTKS